MSSHMLDRLRIEIDSCFMYTKEIMNDGTYVMANGSELKLIDVLDYKNAEILITAYNQMAKLYYKEEFVKEHLYKNVAIEYKKYCKQGKKS